MSEINEHDALTIIVENHAQNTDLLLSSISLS